MFIKRQVESLQAQGLRCDVLFIRGYRSAAAYPLSALRLLAWSLRGHGYRLVHVHGGEAALAGRFYLRAPVVVSYLGNDVLGYPTATGEIPLRQVIRSQMIRQHARLATRTITKSVEMELALPPRVRAKNTVIPNGVNLRVFRPIDRHEARRTLGWDPEAPVALFVARPDEVRKRFWLAQAAVDDARAEFPDARLEVAAGVEPDRVPVLMGAADCLIHPSSSEGSPNVVKEALMCNLPVVATPVGDIPELLDGVSPSFVVPPTAEALADAVRRCFRDRMRSNGRERAAELSNEAICERLLRVYEACGFRNGHA